MKPGALKWIGITTLAIIPLMSCEPPTNSAQDQRGPALGKKLVDVRSEHTNSGENRFQGFPANVYIALDKKTGLLCNTYDFYKGKQRKTGDSFENLPLCADLYLNENMTVTRETRTFDEDRSEEGGDVK